MREIWSKLLMRMQLRFGVINWRNTDIEALQRKCGVLMTKASKHHPKSAIERTLLPRSMGGTRLIEINNQSLRKFFVGKGATSPLHSGRIDYTTILYFFS